MEAVQAANTALRSRYLYMLLGMQGKTCSLNCHERTNLTGIFQSISPTSDYIILSNVTTPSDSIDQCAIRQSDILQLSWDHST